MRDYVKRKGCLLVLDVSTPQSPQIATPLHSDAYSAFRVAAAPEYAYTSADCGVQSAECQQNIIDLAVTSSMQGKINTVDVTDPYNPQVMGVAKDSDGNDVIVTVADIVISKASGLVYITAGNSVYIIDVKDPYNPKLLNIVTETPIEPGSATTTELGYSPALVEKDGWVYLANQNKGMRVLDLDPVFLEQYCEDTEFGKTVEIACTDYYPALGDSTHGGKRAIMLLGRDWTWIGKLKAPARVLFTNRAKLPNGVTVTNDENQKCKTNPNDPNSAIIPDCATFNNEGLATFYVQTNQNFNGSDPISLELEIDLNSITGWANRRLNSTIKQYKTTVKLNVRNNSNVTLDEVLKGQAVFVRDDGKSKGAEDIKEQKGFYYVQELLNQVVPRIGRTYDEGRNDWVPNTYSLINEKGVFDKATSDAVRLFRQSFNMDGESSWRIGNTKVSFDAVNGTYKSADNTTDTFRKLMKDYNYRANATKSQEWVNKIVDKETLVGKVERIPSGLFGFLQDADTQINKTPGNTRNDTGLYELYKNVVVPYVDQVIGEADRYAGTPDFLDPGDELPTDMWYGRNGEGPDVHGGAVSYSYGGKMRVEGFNEQVARAPGCKAEPTSKRSIIVFNKDNDANLIDIASPAVVSNGPDSMPGVYSEYTGNLDPTCETGAGKFNTFKYAGLRQHEKLSSETHQMWILFDPETDEPTFYDPYKTTTKLEQYNPTYWAGIDCSGLTQRSITKANKLEIPGVTSEVKDLGNLGSCPLDDESCKPCGEPIWSQDYMPTFARTIGTAAGKAKTDVLKKVRKGDVVVYPHHVALVHSDKVECKGDDCSYEIIHAYGGDNESMYRYPNNPQVPPDLRGKKVFGRKVIKTWQNISTPTGFGRIKLWD